MQSVSIRAINAESETDLNAAASLSLMDILEHWPEARISPGRVPNFSHEAMRRELSKAVDSPQHLFLLASNGDENVVGLLVASAREGKGRSTAEIFSLYFLPSARDKRLIASAMSRLEEWAAEKQLSEIQAFVHSKSSAEIDMHHQFGFREVSRIEPKSAEDLTGQFLVFSKRVDDPYKIELLEEREIPDEIAMHSTDNQI